MPQRIMGYDYAAYEEQIKAIIDKNKADGNTAVTKRIHDDRRLAPVVTAVLYWGEAQSLSRQKCGRKVLISTDFPAFLYS